jgi:hypothetical protein
MDFSFGGNVGGSLLRSDGDYTGHVADAFTSGRKLGTGAFIALTLYLCQLLFFAILGMGWSWGSFSRSSTIALSSNFDPVATIGSKHVQLKAGKALIVRYDVDIEFGRIDFWLSRSWPAGMVYSEHVHVHKTGQGELKIIAPTDGWYHLVVSPSTPSHKYLPKDYNPADWAKYQRRYKSSYSLSWQPEI